jgi:hypothetical protein
MDKGARLTGMLPVAIQTLKIRGCRDGGCRRSGGPSKLRQTLWVRAGAMSIEKAVAMTMTLRERGAANRD